jgi:hypothetical protein
MTATAILARCRAHGIDLSVDRDGALIWEADADPPAELLEELAKNKAELLAILADPLAAFCGTIEDEQGFPAGSVFFWRPGAGCPGCRYCRPAPPARDQPVRRPKLGQSHNELTF